MNLIVLCMYYITIIPETLLPKCVYFYMYEIYLRECVFSTEQATLESNVVSFCTRSDDRHAHLFKYLRFGLFNHIWCKASLSTFKNTVRWIHYITFLRILVYIKDIAYIPALMRVCAMNKSYLISLNVFVFKSHEFLWSSTPYIQRLDLFIVCVCAV